MKLEIAEQVSFARMILTGKEIGITYRMHIRRLHAAQMDLFRRWTLLATLKWRRYEWKAARSRLRKAARRSDGRED